MGQDAFALHTVEELCAAIASQDAVIAAAEARRYALIREVDRREGCIPGVRPGTEAKVVLRSLRAETPDTDVRLARILGELPQLEKALAAGEASPGHVKAVEQAVRTIRTTNPDALDAAGMAKADTCFVDAARDLAPAAFKVCAKRLVAHLADNGGDTLDVRTLDGRYLVIRPRIDGWVHLDGLLPPDTGARFIGMIDHRAKPRPLCKPDTVAEDDETLPIRDARSLPQRQVDAFDLWLREAGAAGAGPELPHVMIHVKGESPVADCDQSGPLSKAWFGRMLCESTVELLYTDRDDNPLKLGRTVRFPTPPQRRALVARDRTCVIPGCTVPARWCDAHHCLWWDRDHGLTEACNMVMLCGPHHAAVHAKVWILEMRHGVCWAKPPRWLDPEQRWRRNTLKDHLQAAEQLAIDLDPPEAA